LHSKYTWSAPTIPQSPPLATPRQTIYVRKNDPAKRSRKTVRVALWSTGLLDRRLEYRSSFTIPLRFVEVHANRVIAEAVRIAAEQGVQTRPDP
jgi:hypothetical protein